MNKFPIAGYGRQARIYDREGIMAAVRENQMKRRRRVRKTDGRRSNTKICKVCQNETRWLSVDGMCWDCTVNAAKRKVPLYIEIQEEDQDNFEMYSGSAGN